MTWTIYHTYAKNSYNNAKQHILLISLSVIWAFCCPLLFVQDNICIKAICWFESSVDFLCAIYVNFYSVTWKKMTIVCFSDLGQCISITVFLWRPRSKGVETVHECLFSGSEYCICCIFGVISVLSKTDFINILGFCAHLRGGSWWNI